MLEFDWDEESLHHIALHSVERRRGGACYERLSRKPAPDPDAESPYSIVLLLREAHRFTAEELQIAAETAWGRRFDGVEDPMFFVFQQGEFTIVKPSYRVISVVRQTQPYLPHSEITTQFLPQPEQRKAWLHHQAWSSLDLLKSEELPPDDAYKILAKLALQLVSVNCTGIYLPKNNMFMPNDGTAEEGLYRMIRGQLFT